MSIETVCRKSKTYFFGYNHNDHIDNFLHVNIKKIPFQMHRSLLVSIILKTHNWNHSNNQLLLMFSVWIVSWAILKHDAYFLLVFVVMHKTVCQDHTCLRYVLNSIQLYFVVYLLKIQIKNKLGVLIFWLSWENTPSSHTSIHSATCMLMFHAFP